MAELVVGVDVGTGSSKGALVAPDGTVVASTERRHRVSLPRPGHAEMDASSIWWDELASITRELVASAPDGAVAAVCTSGIGPCLLPTDADLRPLRPAVLYGIDTRATAQVADLAAELGEDALLARTGKLPSSQSVGPKVRWLQRHEPEVWARTERWFGCSSYLTARLCGEYVLDHHSASQSDPLYDLPARDWAHDWADRIVGDVPLPRLVWPGEVVGTVHRAAAEATGLPAGTPVVAGTIDAMAEAVSCGVHEVGDLMLMYGSTMFFMQVLDRPVAHPLLWGTTGCDPATVIAAAGTSTAGSLLEWLRDLVGDPPIETVVREAAEVSPGAEGLLVLPYLAGERTPVLDPDARGIVAGLTLRHRRGHLFRAAYEGIAFGIRQILERFDDAHSATRTVAVGGGIKSPVWLQAVSDITGREQLVPEQAIGASYGNALLAGIGAGLVPPDTDWARIDREITPDPRHRARYEDLYEVWAQLYPATRDQVHRLGETGD
jgi:xylulokinase